jgi:hypothetical protein
VVHLRKPEFIVLDKKHPEDFDEDDQVAERHPAATAIYGVVAIIVLIAFLAVVSAIVRLAG